MRAASWRIPPAVPAPRKLAILAPVTVPCFSVGFVWRMPWRSCTSTVPATPEGVRIRTAKNTDARPMATLVMEAFRDSRALQSTSAVHTFKPFAALLRYVEHGDLSGQFSERITKTKANHRVIIAEDAADGSVVGAIEVGILLAPEKLGEYSVAKAWSTQPRDKERRGTPYIGNLAVCTSFRRKGLASRLVHAAEAEAIQWGADTIALHVDARNLPAQQLYRKHGYTCRAREPIWYTDIGRLQRLLLLKKLPITSNGSNGNGSSRKIEDYAEAPVVHTRPLGALEYLRWCLYDLRSTASKR